MTTDKQTATQEARSRALRRLRAKAWLVGHAIHKELAIIEDSTDPEEIEAAYERNQANCKEYADLCAEARRLGLVGTNPLEDLVGQQRAGDMAN